jgi:hypothetical protein
MILYYTNLRDEKTFLEFWNNLCISEFCFTGAGSVYWQAMFDDDKIYVGVHNGTQLELYDPRLDCLPPPFPSKYFPCRKCVSLTKDCLMHHKLYNVRIAEVNLCSLESKLCYDTREDIYKMLYGKMIAHYVRKRMGI